MFKTFGSTKEVFVNQDEGMFVALPITLDADSLTLETEVRQGRTYALAGSVVKDGNVAKGILPEEYDITDGITPARVAVAGYAWASRLTADALAAASSLPNIVVMPYKAVVISLVKASEGVATLRVEGAKWASTVAANQFTFKDSALTISSLSIDENGNLVMVFTGAGIDSITGINSAALVDTSGKTVKGLPVVIDISGHYTVVNVGSYNSGTGVWTDGGTSYTIEHAGSKYIVKGTIPYAAADATLGLDAGNRLQFKLKNTDISAKSQLPDGNIVTIKGKHTVQSYTKDAFETDGSLISVVNAFADANIEITIKWSDDETVKYVFDASAASFPQA